MKKTARLLCAAALAAALLFVSGCHGTKGLREFEMPQALDESRTCEITFWAKNDTNKSQTRIYEQAIKDFEAAYPSIKVTLRLYTDYGRIYNDVITNIPTNTTPNVCITYPDHIATYLTGANSIVPLDGLFEDERYGLGGSEVRFDGPKPDEIVPQYLAECNFCGHYYSVPFMRSTEACYVNKTYVEKLGFTLPDVLTWDFVWEVSDAAAKKDADGTYPVNGQKVMIPFIYKSTDNMMIQLLRQTGGGYSTPEGDILLFSDSARDILSTVAEHAARGAFSTFKISSYPANYLNAGQCIFAVDSTAGATWMGTDAPLSDISEDKFVEFETAVMTVPQISPESPQMISQGPSVCIFNKADPQQVLASWLFTQYLLSDKVQIAYSETEGYVPVTQKARDTAEYRDYLSRCGQDNSKYYEVKIKAAQMLLDNTGNTFVTPVFNGSASLRDAAGQLIENTVKSVKRGETINDEYFTKLYRDVTSLYRLDQNFSSAGETELGALPRASTALLCCVAAAWVLIIIYAAAEKLKKRK